MTPYQLKRSILTAAIQGRLTVQAEAEGTGAELLVANAAERKRRIALEKLKIGKPCKPITEDDMLFDIPPNWTWARFGDLVLNFDSRRRPVTKENRKTTKGLYDYFGATGAIDKVDEYIFDGEFLMIGEDGGNFFVDRDNSFIACGKFWANNHVHVVQPVVCVICYLKHCLDAYNMPNMGLINGIAVPKLNQENMNSIMIPVPPLAEQKRIVAKIEELLPLIDRYEQAWSKLEDFNKRFPVDMQKSILQMAIQGKLVPQHPEEGTGEELFRQIQEKKQRLIKAGTIKKEKPLSEITEDEIPFDIPDSWKWCRLITLGITQTGNTPSKTHPEYTGKDIPFITPGDILNGQIDYNNQALSLIGKEVARVCCAGSIMQVCIGGSIGKAAIADREVTFNQQINVISPMACLSEYIFAVMQSAYFITTMKDQAGGTATPIINRGLWDSLLIPLPPVAEQKRIVAKLEEILPLCDRLK